MTGHTPWRDIEHKSGKTTHGPVTMAMANLFEERGRYELAVIARKYAIDRPRWWHRFLWWRP